MAKDRRLDRHIHRTRESEAARQRAARAREFELTAADLIPRDPVTGEPYSASSLARFRARRARAEKSLPDWILTYCTDCPGGFLDVPPPKDSRLIDVLNQMQKVIDGDGRAPVPICLTLPRGTGKSSYTRGAEAYALAKGKRDFLVAISAATDDASANISAIWSLFEQSPRLAQDYPELVIPIRLSQGNGARAARITFEGVNCEMRKSAQEIHFPRMAGYPNSGAILIARSFLGSVRGLLRNGRRPNLLVIDDPETNDQASSAVQTQAAIRRVEGELLGLASHRKRISTMMLITPQLPGDMAEYFGSGGAHDSWMSIKYPLVLKWPKCWKSESGTDHWKIYLQLKERDNVNGGDESGEYYRVHRGEMDEGARILNTLNYDAAAGEQSALQHAYNLLALQGESAFLAEYQCEHVRPTSAYDLQPSLVRSRLSHVPAFVVPPGFTSLTAAIDVMNTAGLRWAIVAWNTNNAGAAVAYGKYPANDKPLYPPTATQEQADAAVAAGLRVLFDQFAAARIVDTNGKVYRIDCIAADAGWRMRTVIGAIDAERLRKRFVRCDAMRGMAYDKFTPTTASGQLRGGVKAADDYAYTSNSKYGGYLTFHSDFFAESVQRAFFQEPLSAGSLCLFGDDPAVHATVAAEICSDQLRIKDVTRGGQQTWHWAHNYSIGAHALDALKMCMVSAYWHRLYHTTANAASPIPPSRLPSQTAPRVTAARQAPRRANVVRFA